MEELPPETPPDTERPPVEDGVPDSARDGAPVAPSAPNGEATSEANAETGAETTYAEQPVDRRRDAGLRGEEFTSAAWTLALVFLAGVGVLIAVLTTRRKPQDP